MCAPVTAGHTAYGQLKTNRQCVHGPNVGKTILSLGLPIVIR